ncbi:heparin-binding EGF-like growth factor b [Astyanax mexicanus]|uniref:Proheparin-binding EGF-like growth factor n=2 Tax=Astyanax mexicanus TaxID=7994 RepID=A0A8B9K5B3_ASTMX|nr:heparin-binding EGF-like growth factor b [Astyanax mexicanus]KAG9265727.1 proheparin-binding EGF-like growth factor [Astyanax mexicanus]
MNTSVLGLLSLCSLVLLGVSQGAPTEERTQTSSLIVGKLFPTRSPSTGHSTSQRSEDIYSYEEEDQSGDYEVDYPRVAFSTKPKDSSAIPIPPNRRRGKKKKNPCLRKKYRDYCVHGVCQYLETLNHTACICETDYSGERCHIFTLPVGAEVKGYNQTAALAAIAVVLSLMCLTFIGILLAFRCHKKGEIETESEEKIKLEAASVQ